MAWNSVVNGDWSKADFTKAPWVNGVMTLTHEEVLHVLEVTGEIIDSFVVANGYEPPANEYVVPEYNKKDWQYCINGDTYAVVKGYNPDVNTQGINEFGIVSEPVVEEAPIEVPVEETPVEEAGE